MAGVGVADFEGDVHHAHFRHAQQPAGLAHPQVDLVVRGRDAGGGLEQALEGACTLRLDGENNRVYVRRFHYAGFTTQGEARQAFFDLWREVERLGSAEEVERAADGWLERQG